MLLLLAFAVVVGAGTALSPCALPVLPALLATGAAGGRRRPLGVVAGLAATFTVSIAGLAMVVDGVGLGDGALRGIAVVVLAAAGVAIAVPALGRLVERPLAGLSRLAPRSAGDGFWSGVLVGGALGFVYAPCAGPVLAAVVSVGAASGQTIALAAAYALGTAMALLVVAAAGRRVLDHLRRVGGAATVQRVLGVVLVATAVLFAAGLDVRFNTAIARHAPNLTATSGLERSAAVRDRLERLRGAPRFAPARHGAPLAVLGAAPDFTGTQRWFNTPGGRPLSLAALRGRVVLVDFWTYTCINCLRTLPYLEAWDRRYRDAGLTIVGVHAPEFGFEHSASNVAAAISANGIHYPVVQDNDLATWGAWGNQYWPAEYLIDARGRVRHAHFGEGDYGGSETAIRELLREAGRPVAAATARPRGVTPVSAATTPETYVGSDRADRFDGTPPQAGTRQYARVPGALGLSRFALEGGWRVGPQAATALAGATLRARVQARFVYLVLSPPASGGPGRVDVEVDGRRRAPLRVTSQRLYTVAALPRAGRHDLRLRLSAGTSAYAFTFG